MGYPCKKLVAEIEIMCDTLSRRLICFIFYALIIFGFLPAPHISMAKFCRLAGHERCALLWHRCLPPLLLKRRGDFNDEASQNGHCLCRRAQHKQRQGIDGLETKKQARNGTCFKGRVSVVPLSEGPEEQQESCQAKKRERKCSPAQLHCQMGAELLLLQIYCFECPPCWTRVAKKSKTCGCLF